MHIVTIEDPIEYIFKDDKATINQREIGIDCVSFNEALRALVRENPDVVLVGERVPARTRRKKTTTNWRMRRERRR